MKRASALALIVVLAAVLPARGPAATAEFHFADADDGALTAQGHDLYMRNCANCHGRRLQGQALWQLRDQYEGRRAPAHDSSGHTWQHSDDDLFYMTKFGRFPAAPKTVKSYMPAFGQFLGDADIVAVIAYIKSQWPIGIRASQSMLNPGHKGMPAGADKVEWTLPPNCTASFQRWDLSEPRP